MGLRLIIRTDDATMAANVGGIPNTAYTTHVIECPEVEKILRDAVRPCVQAQVVGVEVFDSLDDTPF